MAAKTYTRGSSRRLTANFRLSEMDCKGSGSTSKCGCTKTIVDEKLVIKLQVLRRLLGKAVIINSGYRCDKHNRYVGGSTSSYHKKGMAADIRSTGAAPAVIARLAQELGFNGVGLYTGAGGNFVHVDVRPAAYCWKNTGRGNVTVSGHGGERWSFVYTMTGETLRVGSKGAGVRALQERLNKCGYSCSVDGDFRDKMQKAVTEFQKDMLLETDGIVGAKTRSTLRLAAE